MAIRVVVVNGGSIVGGVVIDRRNRHHSTLGFRCQVKGLCTCLLLFEPQGLRNPSLGKMDSRGHDIDWQFPETGDL